MFLMDMPREQLAAMYEATLSDYQKCKDMGLKLDMSRGKPSKAQLELSMPMLSMPLTAEDYSEAGVDNRNYGVLDGAASARQLFADILNVKVSQVFCGGNASLNLMYDTISKAYTHGLLHSKEPWSKLPCIKFLCPAPGYDRHFAICKSFGMDMIYIPMKNDGPDMDMVEEYVKDPAVKGIWCVPKYSNPDGIIYSDDTIRRIAALRPAAPDFIVMWDNAYCIHEFDGEFVPFLNILEECEKAGNPDMVFEFTSTSKVTFPGAGISCFACSEANIAYMKKLLTVQVISYDKMNQVRHTRFLKDKQGAIGHMKKHAEIMKPKFDVVLSYLDREIAPLNIASWHRPKGGYFVSLNAMKGCAKRIHALMKEAGIVMTAAGATFPNGIDPNDSNLRIAPSLPPISEVEQAMQVLCVCIKLAALEKLLA
ncbi:MAG: aminotransferase class I/II-fold pyridoxal phosphate-dependent enzyme [Clostridia bacterium]|nr:aminotransferase class I/II-fold pyridoxal phosphate-dependent enzyme [Clostridia bacterium]